MNSFIAMMALTLALATTSNSLQPPKSIQSGHKNPQLNQHPAFEAHQQTQPKKRRRRSYVPWSGEISFPQPYQSLSVWKPPLYALERPYFIPIFGVQGRPPIYFPPQPLLVNPGVPKDNPKKYQGPEYLPPRPPTDETTTMSIRDRFNGGDNFDDRPIWDLGSEEQQTTPLPSSNVVPTRLPRPPGGGSPPPLIHNPTNGASGGDRNEVEEARPLPSGLPTKRPPGGTTSRPNEPTRCVWAIISCCSTTGQISYDCFEERGCSGAFWDNSPCDSEFAKAAISAALNYYN